MGKWYISKQWSYHDDKSDLIRKNKYWENEELKKYIDSMGCYEWNQMTWCVLNR